MKLVGVPLLKAIIFLDRIVFYSLKFTFVWMINTKLHYTEKNSVVLYHLMIGLIHLLTIVFYHFRRKKGLKLFVAFFTLCYVSGFGLLSAALHYTEIEHLLFPAAFTCIIIGFAGSKCVFTDLLRIQISANDYDSFCAWSGFLLLISYVGIGSTWPHILDLYPVLGFPDSYCVSFSAITLTLLIVHITFNLNLMRDVYTINSNIFRRETNFKYMVAVLFAPLYYVPKYLLMVGCLRMAPKIKRHRSSLKVGPYFKFALYAFSSNIVNKMVRIWKIVFLMAPFAVYWALAEQQHARWVFTTYHTDRRFEIQGYKFYLHPTQLQLLNPLLHLTLLPLLCYLIYPAMHPWPKKDRIYAVGGLMSFALYTSATIAYRQTYGNMMPLTSKPRTIVTNVVSGIDVNSSMFAKYDIKFGIESRSILPFTGTSINAPVSSPKVYVNFTLGAMSPLEDFSVKTDNVQEAIVQTFFFRGKHLWGCDSVEVFSYMHSYIRPYDFMPTFRVFFANVSPVHEVTLLTPLGHRWLSIPTDSTPGVEFHVEPGMYRFTVNNFASRYPTIHVKYGGYYDAVVYTDGRKHQVVFTTKLGSVQMPFTQMILTYMLLLVPEVVYWIQALRLFVYQAKSPEITQTIILWWYFTIAVGNFIVFWINEMGFELYQFDDYQFFFGVLLSVTRFIYPFIAYHFHPLPGTD